MRQVRELSINCVSKEKKIDLATTLAVSSLLPICQSGPHVVRQTARAAETIQLKHINFRSNRLRCCTNYNPNYYDVQISTTLLSLNFFGNSFHRFDS